MSLDDAASIIAAGEKHVKELAAKGKINARQRIGSGMYRGLLREYKDGQETLYPKKSPMHIERPHQVGTWLFDGRSVRKYARAMGRLG